MNSADMATKVDTEDDLIVAHESHRSDSTGKHSSGLYISRIDNALLEEDPYPWSNSLLRLYACIFVGYLCSATSGFDANTFGASVLIDLVMPWLFSPYTYLCPSGAFFFLPESLKQKKNQEAFLPYLRSLTTLALHLKIRGW